MNKSLQIQVKLSALDQLSSVFKNAKKASEELSHSLKGKLSHLRTLQRTFDANEAQIKKYANTLNPLKAKLSENTQALKMAYAEVRRMENAMKGMSKPTAEFARKLESARQSVKKLKTEQQITAEKLKVARAEFARNGFEAGKMASAQNHLRRQMQSANGEIENQRKKLTKLNQKAKEKAQQERKNANLRTAAEQYANLGGRMAASYSVLKEKISIPVNEFAKAEVAATNLKVAMMKENGNVAPEFEQIKQLADNLGNKLPGTTADFQNLMTMLIRQGMSAKTILGGTGEAAALLAVQLNMMPEQAAEFAAKMQDATQGTEIEMLDLMDIIQRGFYSGVDSNNMLGAFKNLAPALSLLKVKGKEAMTVLAPLVAQMDQAGMDGQAAGNALRKVFAKSMDTQKIQKELADIRGSLVPKDFNLDFTNGNGEFGGIDKLYNELSKLKGLTSEARLNVIKSIFGDDAEVNTVLASMIEKGKSGYEEFADKLKAQATLNERVNAQLSTLTNIWESTTGTFTNLMVSLGEVLAPQLKELANWLGEISQKILEWVKANPVLASTIMKVAAGLTAFVGIAGILASAFSFLIFPISKLITGFGWLGTASKVLFSGLITGIRAVGAAFMANPIGAVITVIIGLIALIIYNWDKLKPYFVALWEFIKNTFNRALQGIKNIWGNVVQWFSQLWDKIKNLISGVGNFILEQFENVKSRILGIWDSIGNAIGNAISGVKKFLGFGNDANETASQLAKNAQSNGGNLAIVKTMEQKWIGGLVGNGKGFASGGFTGNGGKYTPAGIVHRGEYVMTKEATARLGVGLLDKLNYGGAAMLAGTLAMAQPIQIDQRPPLQPKQAVISAQPSASPVINITINAAAGQTPEAIAKEVAKQLDQRFRQGQARQRSSLFDR